MEFALIIQAVCQKGCRVALGMVLCAVTTLSFIAPVVSAPAGYYTLQKRYPRQVAGLFPKKKTDDQRRPGPSDNKKPTPNRPGGSAAREKLPPVAPPAAAPAPRTSADQLSGGSGEVTAQLPPDAAMISVLRDLSKALADAQQIEKLEDECQKSAARIAARVMAKALENKELPSNRIINDMQEIKATMTAEAWESGDVSLAPDCHGSMSAVWAKKSNGLVSVSIAGICNTASENLGEFVVVLTGRSAVDTGFDIQSQGEVSFWLGKLVNVAAETAACSGSSPLARESQPTPVLQSEKKKLTQQPTALVLRAVLTERIRKHQTVHGLREQQRTMTTETSERAAQREPEQALAARRAVPLDTISGAAGSTVPIDSRAEATMQADARGARVSGLSGEEGRATGWESPAQTRPTSPPSSGARILHPDRVVAGQHMTVALVDDHRLPEANVGVTFNGTTIATGRDGRIVYQVPEDAIPGFTLKLSLNDRPGFRIPPIQVFQPLMTPSVPQIPKVDKVTSQVLPGSTLVIDGHNFDGVSDRNRVIIDGVWDARPVVSSPVQLKAEIPANLAAGPHSVSVSTAGLRSNPGNFEVVSIDVRPPAKDRAKNGPTKLVVRAVGTEKQVRVHVKNVTPDVLRIQKGNDLKMLTAGGQNNLFVINVQRLKPGEYKIQAGLE